MYLQWVNVTVNNNPPIRMCVRKIQNRSIFKVKTITQNFWHLKQWKLLEGTESKISKSKNGVNIRYLEVIKVVSVHCNIVNNHCQCKSKVLYSFIPDQSFGQLWKKIFSKTIDSEFWNIEVWFIYQNAKPIKIEYNIVKNKKWNI